VECHGIYRHCHCFNGVLVTDMGHHERTFSASVSDELDGLAGGRFIDISASAVWWEEAFMAGRIYRFLAEDHARLDGLLQRAMMEDGTIDRAAYAEFRAGLLKHIGMEEKILLPAAQRARGGEPLALAAKLRLDHGALAALLVPTPTPAIVAALRTILGAHNALEEGPEGLYERCERLAGAEAEALLAQLQAALEVPVVPHTDGPHVMDVVRRALARAGYEVAFMTDAP
jgi:hypothetical protein